MDGEAPTGRNIREIEKTGDPYELDRHIKTLLSEKALLSLILKYAIKELSNYSLKEIETFIEGDVEIGENPVMPHGRKNSKVEGMNQESQPTGEGKIVFDLKFKLLLPEDEPDEYRHVIVKDRKSVV